MNRKLVSLFLGHKPPDIRDISSPADLHGKLAEDFLFYFLVVVGIELRP
jgi:hypothetical protein